MLSSEDSPTCFFCGRTPLRLDPAQGLSGYFYNCPFCGKYIITSEAETLFRGVFEKKRHLVAGYLHSLIGKSTDTPVITESNCTTFFDNGVVPKNAMEKLDKLLIDFYLKDDSIGTSYNLGDYIKEPELFYAKDQVELAVMLDELAKMGFIESQVQFFKQNTININDFRLTTRGLMRAAEFTSLPALSKNVFVAMGFKEDLLRAKDEAIRPACRTCGFEADTVAKDHNDDITDKIISEIKASRFVVCDFTYGNQGAYYEAGFARGLGLPVICCCNRNWLEDVDENGIRKNKLHFDVEHINTIFWSTYEEYREKLIDRIKATIL